MKKMSWNLPITVLLISIVVIGYGFFAYNYSTLDHLNKLGSIGSYLSGAGIFILVIQLIMQHKSYAIELENERLSRIWNISEMIDSMLMDFTKYKNNRTRIATLLRRCVNKASLTKNNKEIIEIKLENNLLIKKINNRTTSLATLYLCEYVEEILIKQCQTEFICLRKNYLQNKLSTDAIDILLHTNKPYSRNVFNPTAVARPKIATPFPSLVENTIKDEIPSIIKELADAISKAAGVQNRYWIALILTSIFAVVSQLPSKNNARVLFPGLMVDSSWFIFFAIPILSVLLIAFCAAQAHLVRTHSLADRILCTRRKQKNNSGTMVSGEDERDLLHSLLVPSLSHVSALAQVIRGPNQFFVDKKSCFEPLKWCSFIIYFFLKIIVIVVWLIFPAYVFYLSVVQYMNAILPIEITTAFPCITSSWFPYIIWSMIASAAFSWFVAVFLELFYLARSMLISFSRDS